MYCIKCGAELPTEAKFCVGCGTGVDALPIVPVSEESITEITSRNTAQNTLLPAKPARPLPQDRTMQVAGGALAILLLIGASYWYLVERNMIREPVYKVGDTWTFIYPAFMPLANSTSWYEQLRAKDSKLEYGTYKVTRANGSRDVEARIVDGDGFRTKGDEWTGLWVSEGANDKQQKRMRFPLQPGKTWGAAPKETGTSGAVIREEMQYRIGEWETVTVAAGSFRALPIQVTTTTYMHILDKGQTFASGETVWFSPDVKQAIKVVRTEDQHVIRELKSYTVK